jgi:Protein of unknown function (DUF2950)
VAYRQNRSNIRASRSCFVLRASGYCAGAKSADLPIGGRSGCCVVRGRAASRRWFTGAENWPFPIPILGKSGTWYFDTEQGKEEILARRIGKNELAALDACQQLVDAEKQYHTKALRGEHEYADRFVSDPGKHNGLFWSRTADDFDSPLNPLIAYAGEENVRAAEAPGRGLDPIPYNGYYFRILMGQGTNAEGGAKGYVVDGKMVAGFAFVAYPVEYRSSGVMAFIVDQDGAISEKDLGPDTSNLASVMTEFNPDSTWQRAN